ncbi:MAG: hypothetical protein AB7P03_22000 [Kofleriaceae bacterium]
MPITSLSYAPPVRRSSVPPKLDYEAYEQASALADEGKHRESLSKIFEHLFPGRPEYIVSPDAASFELAFVQGSSRVRVQLLDGELIVTVPLAKLPSAGNAIAAMRYVLTKISGSGQLHQPRLHGDDIYLEFRDKVSRLHPNKIVEVFRRMPIEADTHDDWMIGQFAALPLARVEAEPLDGSERARCEAIWSSHWNDVEELLKESQRKRSTFFLNEVTAYTIYRVWFALPLSGFLSSRMSESARTFNDGDIDPVKREAVLARCIKEMKAVTTAELHANLGHRQYAINPLVDGDPDVLDNYLGAGNYTEQIEKLRETGKTFDAALALISTYNFLLARYSWPELVASELKAGLEAASGKPWREAATVLWDHAQQLVATFSSDEDDDDDGDQQEQP